MTHFENPVPSSASNGSLPLVQLTRRLETREDLDEIIEKLRPLAQRLVDDPQRRDVLLGRQLGHALHPLLTDLPLGMWMSAVTLDIFGPRTSRPAAQRLLGFGILAAVPTAVTGLAEWAFTDQKDARVGLAHATGNSAALLAFTTSYCARRRGHNGIGAALGILGGLFATASGYLGGHLAIGRKVGSHVEAS